MFRVPRDPPTGRDSAADGDRQRSFRQTVNGELRFAAETVTCETFGKTLERSGFTGSAPFSAARQELRSTP